MPAGLFLNIDLDDLVINEVVTVEEEFPVIEMPVAKQNEAPDVNTKVESNSSGGDVTVYITNSGSKYHKDGCRYLNKSKIPTSLSSAKASGYSPCSVYNPPR